MKRLSVIVGTALAAVMATAGAAQAITFGQPDGNLHPEVGALLMDWNPDSPGPDAFCTGTLIAPDVVLTAGHCTVGLDRVMVTFDPTYDENAEDPTTLIYEGTAVTHPEFGFSGPGGMSDPHDIAVILLDEPVVGITPAQLPTLGLLDQLKGQHQLDDETFTAVGYGLIRDTKRGGPHGITPAEGVRLYALQEALSLQKAWLTLSMNPSTGSGGTCYGDSGGPHFLGDETSHLLVSITVTGDAMCRATDKTYRLDTESARAFLGAYVTLP